MDKCWVLSSKTLSNLKLNFVHTFTKNFCYQMNIEIVFDSVRLNEKSKMAKKRFIIRWYENGFQENLKCFSNDWVQNSVFSSYTKYERQKPNVKSIFSAFIFSKLKLFLWSLGFRHSLNYPFLAFKVFSHSQNVWKT